MMETKTLVILFQFVRFPFKCKFLKVFVKHRPMNTGSKRKSLVFQIRTGSPCCIFYLSVHGTLFVSKLSNKKPFSQSEFVLLIIIWGALCSFHYTFWILMMPHLKEINLFPFVHALNRSLLLKAAIHLQSSFLLTFIILL